MALRLVTHTFQYTTFDGPGALVDLIDTLKGFGWVVVV